MTYIRYSHENILDIFGIFNESFAKFRSSPRFLEVLTLGTILLFILLASLKISRIFGVPLMLLPFFVIYHLLALIHKPSHKHLIQGKVMDVWTNTPISDVVLHFAKTSGKVLAHTRTNENGEFTVTMKDLARIKISVNKKGYNTFSKVLNKQDLTDKLTVVITKIQKPESFGWGTVIWYLESLTGSLFEAFLVLTLIAEGFFAYQFGLIVALPCIIVSSANILLWAVQTKHKN